MGNKNLKSYVSGPVSKASLALIFAATVGMSVFADWYGPGRAEAAPTANGMVVYSNNSTTPQYRSYTAASNTFDAATATLANAAQTFVVTKSATTRNEKMVGYVTTGGVLYVMRWNGSAWSNEWNVTVGGNGVDGRRFDITYENTSGNAMVAYSTNATGTAGNEIAYRIWDGSTWTAATNINSARFNQNATVTWIKLKSRPTAGSNEIAMTAADTGTTTGNNSILTSFIWNGSTWTEPGAAHANDLPNTTTPLLRDDLFDMAYESTSGDLLVVFTTSNNQQYYRTYSGGTWGVVTSYGTGRSAPLQMIAASNPNTNQILVVWSRSGSADIFGNIWSGAGISATTTVGTNGENPSIEKKGITGQWLNVSGTDYAVVVWNTNTAGTLGRNYYTGGAWGSEGTYNTGTGVTANWMDSDADPQGSDTMMLTFSTGAAGSGRLWAKRLVLSAGPTFTWTNADGGAALTTTLASVTTQNFDFAYNIITTMTTVGDGTNPSNATIGPGGTTTDLDAFTLQINTGTDTITALTVTLGPANAYLNIDSVAITSDDGLTTYGTATGLASNTVNITLTPNITATTTSTQYRVKITPKSHANMPAVPGASYDTTGTVTAVTSTFPPSYNDTASATITVDNGSPANAAWGTITPIDTQITLNWTNPGDADFSQVVILKKTSAIADAPTEGATYIAGNTIGTSTVVYAGSLQTYADTSVINGTNYYYKIFSKDTRGNYAAGVQTGPHVPNNMPPSITAGPNQYKTDAATVITQGGYTSEAAARFKATATDPDGNTYKLDVEVVTTASAFTNTATCSSALVASGAEASTANCGAFVNGTGYKWQYRVVDSLNNASTWTAFGASDPDLTRDATAPSVSSTIPANEAIDIGLDSAVTITWQAGEDMDCSTVTTDAVTISPVSGSWTQTSCSGNQAVFTPSGQSTSTIYTVTVLSGASGVKDLAGNQQASDYVFSYTTSPPATKRIKTVTYFAGQYDNSVTNQNSDSNLLFTAFNVNLPEAGAVVMSAYTEVAIQHGNSGGFASSITGIVLSFIDTVTTNLNIAAPPANTGDSQVIIARQDVTARFTGYTPGTNKSVRIGYRVNDGGASADEQAANAKLVITYEYEDVSATQLNTVIYPLRSTTAGDQGTKRAQLAASTTAPFTYNVALGETGVATVHQWFDVYQEIMNAGTTDQSFTANINGGAATAAHYFEEALSANVGGYRYLVDGANYAAVNAPVTGFAVNSSQTFNFVNGAGGPANLVGGEAYYTYTFNNAASTAWTKTVRYGLGEINTANNATKVSKAITVRLPETGVTIKEAWFRIKTTSGAADTLSVTTTVGAGAETAATAYTVGYTATLVGDVMIIHAIPTADLASITDGTAVTLSTQWTTGGGATSAELLITYQYTGSNSYQSTAQIFGGQRTAAAGTTLAYATLNTYFPESAGKTMLSAFQESTNTLNNFTVAGTGTRSSDIEGALGTTSTLEHGTENFTETFYHDVTSQITTANATYTANYTSSVNTLQTGLLVYTYRFVPTLTVGDGTNPSNATIGPGGATTDLDIFTLQMDYSADTITALTVTLGPANAYQNIDSVSITNNSGSITYGTVTGLASNTVTFSTLTPNISVSRTPIQYRIKITPKSHAAMPAVPGASYDTTGTVTAVTSTFPKSYNDTASATITVDNGSPANAAWGTIVLADTQITLNWTNPGDADFSQVVILKKTSAIADAPTEGATYIAGNTIGTSTVVYAGSLQTYADTSVINGTNYYYKIFSKDTRGNYSAGVQTGPHVPNNQPPSITAGPNQYKTDATTVITQGGYTTEAAARFKATATDVDGNTYKLDVEVVTTASAFTNTATCSSALVASGAEASTANCGAFVNGTGYKWQYRVVDSLNNASAWTAFGASDPDFTRDTTAPSVASTIPANGATGVTSPAVTINWQAGEDMDCSTVTTTTVTISPAPTSWTKTSCSGNQAVFTASGQASSTVYTVTVVSGASGVKDLAGNQQAANYVFSYTTGNTPPSAVSNLSVVTPNYTRGFRLTWTAPSATIGAVASYDFRYKDAADYPATMSTTYLDTNWASLTQAQSEPTPAASGTTEYFNMTTDTASNKMTPNTLYYIAMKSKNDAGTDSSISNIVSDHTAMKYGYNIIGLPYNPAATSTFNALFSDDMYPTTNPVYAMKWDSFGLDVGGVSQGQWTYVDPSTVPANGVGYWVYAYCMNCSVLDDQLGDVANGASVIIPLEKGWNDISNTYLKNVLVSNTYLCKSVGGIVTGFTAPNCTGTGAITTNTFANAVTAGWTNNAVYYYANSSTWDYETYDGSGGKPVANLRPWWGQRIYAGAADAPNYTQGIGIGTVSTSGTAVTGVGTSFLTNLAVGNMINIGGQVRVITVIDSDTSLTVGNAFSPNLPAGTLYSYSADTTSYFVVIIQP